MIAVTRANKARQLPIGVFFRSSSGRACCTRERSFGGEHAAEHLEASKRAFPFTFDEYVAHGRKTSQFRQLQKARRGVIHGWQRGFLFACRRLVMHALTLEPEARALAAK
jgi:hypothetical protein